MTDTRYLALCAIAKDETPFLREWVEYHALIGVEHFIVFDNESAIPIAQTLADHVASGLVTVLTVSGYAIQLPAYNHCLQNFAARFQWIGFIDLDEYVCLAPPLTDLRLLLADYEEYGGLGLNWSVFGSSNHLRRPDGLLIENYRRRLPLDHEDNIHIKTFVRSERAVRATNPHCFEYKPGFFCVNETREPLSGPVGPHVSSRARINHYYYRSQEDFCRKVERGRADAPQMVRSLEEFYSHLRLPHVQDDAMLEPARRLKALSAGGAAAVRAWADRFEEPLAPEAAAARARDLLAQGQPAEAELTLLAARRRCPDASLIRLTQAALARLFGRLDEALRHAHEATRLDMSLEAYMELLRIHAAAGRRDQARTTLNFILHTLRQSGNPPEVVQSVRGECEAILGQPSGDCAA